MSPGGEERGSGFAEYVLILALIAVIAIVVLLFLGPQVGDILRTIREAL